MSSSNINTEDPLDAALNDAEKFMAELQTNDSGGMVIGGFAIDSDDEGDDDGKHVDIDLGGTGTTTASTMTESSTATSAVDLHPLHDDVVLNPPTSSASAATGVSNNPSASAATSYLGGMMGGNTATAANASLDSFKASTSRFASNIATMAQRTVNQMKQTNATIATPPTSGNAPPLQSASPTIGSSMSMSGIQGMVGGVMASATGAGGVNARAFFPNPNAAGGVTTGMMTQNSVTAPNGMQQQQPQQQQQQLQPAPPSLQSLDNEQKQALLLKHVGDLLPGEQIIMFLTNLLHVTDSTGFQYRAGGMISSSGYNNYNQQSGSNIIWCCVMTYYRIILFATTADSAKNLNSTSSNTNDRYLDSLLSDWNIHCILPSDPTLIDMPLASLDKVEKVVYTASGTTMNAATGVNNQTTYMGLSLTNKLGRFVRFTTTSYADTTRALEALQTYAFVGKRNLGFLFAFESKRTLVMSSVVTDPNTGNNTVALPPNPRRFDPIKEFTRQGILRPNCPWKLWTTINNNYQLCASYPNMIVGPARLNIDNNDPSMEATGQINNLHSNTERARHMIQQVALFRSEGRLPILTWMSQTDGASLWRCSQPKVGLQGNRSGADELLLKHIMESASIANAMNPQIQQQRRAIPYDILSKYTGMDGLVSYQLEPNCALKIMDMRPRSSAMANRTGGYGYENTSYYPGCTIQFCNIGNIHAVRDSYNKITNLCLSNTTNDIQWNSLVDDTKWLYHLRTILTASWEAAFWIHIYRLPIVLHCSHGWDRTSQVSALCQILLDDYFRTCDGFACLVEKDFLSAGHPFHTRCAHGEGKSMGDKDKNSSDRGGGNKMAHYSKSSNALNGSSSNNKQDNSTYDEGQVSPIFLQFLDCVYQLVSQFPDQFEYNTKYIYEIVRHIYSCRFGNFLCDTEREREFMAGLRQRTYCLWEYLDSNPEKFKNTNFDNTTASSGMGGIASSVLLMPLSTLLRQVHVWPDLHLKHGPKVSTRMKCVEENDAYLYQNEDDNENITNSNDQYYEDVQKSIWQSISSKDSNKKSVPPTGMPPTSTNNNTPTTTNNNVAIPQSEEKQTTTKEEGAAADNSNAHNDNEVKATSSGEEDVLI